MEKVDDKIKKAEDLKMSNKLFTTEEMEQLRSSKWVIKVTPRSVNFNKEFKTIMYTILMEEGKYPREALYELGINPDILGDNRIEGLSYTIRKAGNSGEIRDIKDLKNDYATDDVKDEKATIKQMSHKITYLEQELEFLKKMLMKSMGKK